MFLSTCITAVRCSGHFRVWQHLLIFSLHITCSRVLLEKLTGSQLVKEFLKLYATRSFITAFTSACQPSLSWSSSIHSIPLHPTSWRSILILSSHLRLGVDCVSNVMAHAQKPDLVFRRNGVHLNLLGRQFSRILSAELCASALVMLDTPCSVVVWRVLAIHSVRQFPFYFLSRASSCAITFQLDSTNLSLSLRFPHQNPVYASRLPHSATCPAHHFILDLITRTNAAVIIIGIFDIIKMFVYFHFSSWILSSFVKEIRTFNTLRTGDADLRFYITTVQDGWRKSAFLTRSCFPCTIHLIMQYIEPVSEWYCWRMFIETWPHSELIFRHRASSI